MMRQYQRALKTVPVYVRKTVDSGYVGTESKYIHSADVRCSLHPADGKISAEIYGERVYSMIKMICPVSAAEFDGAAIDSGEMTHKVVSRVKHTDHQIVILEAIV